MKEEQNKVTVQRLVYELFNRTHVQVTDELLAPGYVDHDPVLGQWSSARGIKQLCHSLRTAFPDGHLSISDQFAEGDKVITRWAFRGTQFGAFEGIPASGDGVWITGMSIHRVVDGRIQEGWTGLERVKWGDNENSVAFVLRLA